MSLQAFIYNVAENALSVAALEALKINDLIPDNNNNPMSRYVKMGAMWTLADELVIMLRTGTSHFQEGNYYFLLDQLFVNSALYGAIETSGVGEMVLDIAENVPVPAQYHGAIASGVLKVGAKTLTEIIQTQYANTSLGLLVSPTQLIRQ